MDNSWTSHACAADKEGKSDRHLVVSKWAKVAADPEHLPTPLGAIEAAIWYKDTGFMHGYILTVDAHTDEGWMAYMGSTDPEEVYDVFDNIVDGITLAKLKEMGFSS